MLAGVAAVMTYLLKATPAAQVMLIGPCRPADYLFGSKEELVAAYLASRQDQITGQLTDAMSRVDGPAHRSWPRSKPRRPATASPVTAGARSSPPPPGRHPEDW